MTKATKVSPTMQGALDAAREHGGRLVRWPGGFWTYPDCPTRGGGSWDTDYPTWSVAAGTIKSLLARGLVREVDWREARGFNGPYRFAVAVEVVEP